MPATDLDQPSERRVTPMLRLRLTLLPVVAACLAARTVAADVSPPAVTGLAPFFTPAAATPRAPDADGFLQRWLLLEPIVKPNRSNAGFTPTYVRQALTTVYFPGQFGPVPRDGQVARAAMPLRWHALDAATYDLKLFNFAQGLNKPTYGVIFWAVTVVNSPREMPDVRLAVGSNSASMWWVNGQEAAGLFGDRRMVMDDVVSRPLTLKKGRNVIRGAVINGPGLSDFCIRILDAKGQPVRDITLTTR
jgi:hypothetical protein